MRNDNELTALNGIRSLYHDDVEKIDLCPFGTDEFETEIIKHIRHLRDESRAMLIYQELHPESAIPAELLKMQKTLMERVPKGQKVNEKWGIAFYTLILDLGKMITRARELYQRKAESRHPDEPDLSPYSRILERRRVFGKDYIGYVVYPSTLPPENSPVRKLPEAYLRFRNLPLEDLEWRASEADWKVRTIMDEEPFWEVRWPEGEILRGLSAADTAPYTSGGEPLLWKAYRRTELTEPLPQELLVYYSRLIKQNSVET